MEQTGLTSVKQDLSLFQRKRKVLRCCKVRYYAINLDKFDTLIDAEIASYLPEQKG